MHTHDNDTTIDWPWAFRLYVQFAQVMSHEDYRENYSSGAIDVVMDYIADHIDDPAIQGLAAALGEWEEGRR